MNKADRSARQTILGNSIDKLLVSNLDVPSPSVSVVGTGLITLDIVLNSQVEEPARLWAGGTCGNVLAILSYLGWQSFPVARLNRDSAAQHVVSDLKKWNVNLNFINEEPTASTPIIVQQIRSATAGDSLPKFLWTCPRCGAWLPAFKPILATTVRKILPLLPTPQVFFFDRVSRGTLLLAQECSGQGALVIFEPSGIRDPKLFREALSLAHVVKYSKQRGASFREMIPIGLPRIEIETCGEGGIRYRMKSETSGNSGWRELQGYRVLQVKDTVGSGDWCTAGLIHVIGRKGASGINWITEDDLEGALNFGQALAAWNCSFEGARGGMYIVNRNNLRENVIKCLSEGALQAISSPIPDLPVDALAQSICPACEKRMVVSR